MPLRYHRHITRDMLQADPATLWVFGDNLAGAGLGGQAAEMRGEPNAVGIPTKRRPANDPAAFFTDQDLAEVRAKAAPIFARLRAHIEHGGEVAWPADGIGTGRAQLAQRAPRIWRALEAARLKLEAIAR